MRFKLRFYDPAFSVQAEAIERLETIAWDAYSEGRKSPVTRKAGQGFADPNHDLSVRWWATRDWLQSAEQFQKTPGNSSRVLWICGSARNDGTCPGEMSKTWRLTQLAREVIEAQTAKAKSDKTTKLGRQVRKPLIVGEGYGLLELPSMKEAVAGPGTFQPAFRAVGH